MPNKDGCSKNVCSPDVVAVSVFVRRRRIICNAIWKNTSKPRKDKITFTMTNAVHNI